MRSPRKDRLLVVVWALVVITLMLDVLVLTTGCPPGVGDVTMTACKTMCTEFAVLCAILLVVAALIIDRLWRRSMRELERNFYAQFPNSCLRCTATRTGDSERADTYGWKHSATCRKGNHDDVH